MPFQLIRKIGFFDHKQSNVGDEIVNLSMNAMNFVRVKHGANELILLLDTGASVSVIFANYAKNISMINTGKKVKINGIAGSTVSVGSANICLDINNAQIKHEFLVLNEFGSGMHGVIGSDFFIKHSATINYEKFLFSFWLDNRKVCMPLESNYDYCMSIPPRCEIIKYCKIDCEDDCVILPEELCEGVYVAGILARPKQGMIPVKVLNVNEREIKLRNFKPVVEKLVDYEVCSFGNTEISVNRVDRLLPQIDVEALNVEEKFSIHKICAKFADVFHLEKDPLTVTNISKHKIHLKENATPVYVKPYRLPHAQKGEIHKQVEKMLSDGIIEETRSEWSSPLLIVPKKVDHSGNKKWRIVIDYRLLNKQIKDDNFPLPCISEILDSLSGAVYFSHLDLAQGYYQVELDQASRPCTAFTTERGQFQMKRLPMGLKISPSTFSRVMTIAMAGLNYESCFVYLDDLIIFGNNLVNHNQNLVKVLTRLREVNLKLNPNKCKFLRKEILYLGHVISSAGILPDPEKIRAIQKYPTPQNSGDTKRFVAFANYYRKFIKNFATIAQPLNNLTRKNVTFQWNEECQKSFEKLKQALIKPPVLQYPDFSDGNHFILRTDASGQALGATLSNSNDRPVAYASRALNKAEKNYCTVEKEILGVTWAVRHFRPFLYARKFHIYTDHKPLIYLFSMTNPSSRLTKFRLILEEYDFTINYIKGSDNVAADALSRIQIDSDELKDMNSKVIDTMFVTTRAQAKHKINKKCGVDDGAETIPIDERLDHPGVVELLKQPAQSVELRPINENKFNRAIQDCHNDKCYKLSNLLYDLNEQVIYLKQNSRSASAFGASLRDLKYACMKYKIPELCIIKKSNCADLLNKLVKFKDELLKANIKICVIKDIQTITNKELRQLILNDFHILPTGGHAGINRMYNNIKRYYFWSGLRRDVETFVKHCSDCQKFKYSKPNKEPLSITSTATVAFQKVFLDLVGPLSPDEQNNRYILTLQCELSKFVEGYSLPNKEATTVAKSFVENFVLRYGVPESIVTDQGTEFLAETFKETCKLLGINQLNSTAYHHETLGALENTHKSLGAYLRIQLSKGENNWSTWVPYWCFAYNNTVHTETRYTPHELVFGRSSRLPSNVTLGIDPLYNFDDYPLELKYRLQVACNDARDNLVTSKTRRKELYDRNINKVNYKAGDQILLKNESGTKLEPLYKGPYEVVEEKSPNIIIKIDNKLVEVHKNRIKMYLSRDQNN